MSDDNDIDVSLLFTGMVLDGACAMRIVASLPHDGGVVRFSDNFLCKLDYCEMSIDDCNKRAMQDTYCSRFECFNDSRYTDNRKERL